MMVRLERRNKNRSVKNDNVMLLVILITLLLAITVQVYLPQILKLINLNLYLIHFSK